MAQKLSYGTLVDMVGDSFVAGLMNVMFLN